MPAPPERNRCGSRTVPRELLRRGALIPELRALARDRRVIAGAAIVTIVVILVVALVAPSSQPRPEPTDAVPSIAPSQTASPSPTPAATPSPSPEPSPSPSVEPVPLPTDGVGFPCGEADPDCATARLQSRLSVPLTSIMDCGAALGCQLAYDVFWPPEGGNLPTVVMIPGGPAPPGNRVSLWPLARYVAARGAVVFVADYRASTAYGGGLPATFGDVSCALATAAQETGALGGSGRRVTLVTHSYGGFPGAVAATTRTPPSTPECLVAGARRPDAFVGIAGVYLPAHLGASFVEEFVGGTRETASEAWDQVDAAVLAAESARDPIPVTLIVGTTDLVGRQEHADELGAALESSGYNVTRRSIDGATHDGILERVETVETVVAALAP